MAEVSNSTMMGLIKQVNFNPNEIIRLFLKSVEEATGGAQGYFDPTNPTVLAIEAGVLTPAAVLQEIETVTRRLYAPAVDNIDDLLLHMQEIDHAHLTNLPGSATVTILMAVDELKRKAVPVNGNEDVRVIEFPAHTRITVGEYDLMFRFPFTIRINRYGSISVKYNLSGDPVLGRVRDAVIAYSTTIIDGMEVIRIPVECVQTSIASQNISVSPSTGFKQRIALKNKFHTLKAFTRFRDNGEWIPIDTTFRSRVLNKNRATIQVQPLGGQLNVSVPAYYFNSGMIGNSIRLDIYTTKGAVEHSLANYNDGAFSMHYYDYNNPNNIYAGILGSLTVLKCYSDDTIVGGRDGLSFDRIKDLVIQRSTISEGLPITEKEIVNKLSDYGFSTVQVLDDVSDRIFATSRLIDPPTSGLTVTGVGCNVQLYQTTIKELEQLPTVRTNGARLTVLPSTLYNVVDGVLKVVDANVVDNITNPALNSPENLAAWANTNDLVFSPYYYVHDTNDNEYSARPYRLDNPKVSSKVMVNENPSLQLDANIFDYRISVKADGTGFELLLGLGVGANFKLLDPQNISLQISYLDQVDGSRYYLNGELATPINPQTGRPVDDNYIYRFNLNTNWDIDSDHRLILSDAFLPIPLEVELDVFIIIKDYTPEGFSKTDMDNITNISSLSNYDGSLAQYALTQERLSVSLGKYMEALWQRSRTIISAADYKRYEEDIQATWADTVYSRDANNVIETAFNPTTGKVEPIILHNRGDLRYDANGLAVWRHRIGDIVLEQGQPVFKEGLRGLTRQVDLVVMDGLYYLSTHNETINYVRSVLDVIDGWVFDNIVDIFQDEMLVRTDIFYHPKSTVGMIEVFIEDGLNVLIQSDQAFYVKLFVTKTVHSNLNLRSSLEMISKRVLQETLEKQTTISVTDLTSALKDALGENVVGIELRGFTGNQFNTITVKDALTTPSIGKRLTVNSKLELVVEDNVEFDFVRHSSS